MRIPTNPMYFRSKAEQKLTIKQGCPQPRKAPSKANFMTHSNPNPPSHSTPRPQLNPEESFSATPASAFCGRSIDTDVWTLWSVRSIYCVRALGAHAWLHIKKQI